jgi:hypothetical protein
VILNGEVFTVGDEVDALRKDRYNSQKICTYKIEKMYPYSPTENEMRVYGTGDPGPCNWPLNMIYHTQKSIQVLLTPSQIEKLKQLLK